MVNSKICALESAGAVGAAPVKFPLAPPVEKSCVVVVVLDPIGSGSMGKAQQKQRTLALVWFRSLARIVAGFEWATRLTSATIGSSRPLRADEHAQEFKYYVGFPLVFAACWHRYNVHLALQIITSHHHHYPKATTLPSLQPYLMIVTTSTLNYPLIISINLLFYA